MRYLVVIIYLGYHISTDKICRHCAYTGYVQEKGYCKLLVSLSMLFVKKMYIPESFFILLSLV